jgi:hypothetical protein
MVDYRITPDERTRFKRCRRQWDFTSPHRRDLEPVDALASAPLPSALKDALAVYYYPGTWDWQHQLKQSLVHKALLRSLAEVGAVTQGNIGAAVLDCYDAWATAVDDFAPVKIEHDVQALVPDPTDSERGLLTADGVAVVYTCRVDLLAVDASDEYWVVRHQIVDSWQPIDALEMDEEAVAACWAWEQDYISVRVAGTIHNELLVNAPLVYPGREHVSIDPPVAQHEPSGGGRSIPQHVRAHAGASRPRLGGRITQRTAGIVRRTRIRRTRAEIEGVGGLLAAEAVDMVSAPAPYPSFGPHCSVCEFRAPCLAVLQGRDPQPMLAAAFHRRAAATLPKPRLGQATWGFGRGAAPPNW